MSAKLNPIVRFQEYVRLGTAGARYYRLTTGEQRLESTRAGDVVRVHVRVHCNRQQDHLGIDRRAKQSLLNV